MKIANYPSAAVKAFGERVSAAMYDAQIQHSMGGLGGCDVYYPNNYDIDVRLYVEEYLKGNLDGVAIMYAAMRTKELELS